jgi:hypothetical protein
MIRVVHPGFGSRIRILIFNHPGSLIPDSGARKALDLGSGPATLYEYNVFARQRSDGNQQARAGLHA